MDVASGVAWLGASYGNIEDLTSIHFENFLASQIWIPDRQPHYDGRALKVFRISIGLDADSVKCGIAQRRQTTDRHEPGSSWEFVRPNCEASRQWLMTRESQHRYPSILKR